MIRCALIGCGNIAGFLDKPEDDHIVTHAHALLVHPETELIACCDPDENQLRLFRERWGETITPYSSATAMLENESIDLLIISSPTRFHADAVRQALQYPAIHTLICEKPFVETRQELDDLLPLIASSKKRLLVNYIRRFDPSIRKVASIINNGELGELRHFHGTFTKGLYHNGSHMLELVEHLCGQITRFSSIESKRIEDDFFGSFFLKTSQCRGTLSNESGDSYALFELDILLSKGRVRILDSGHSILIDTLVQSERYSGYHTLALTQELPDTMNAYALHTLEFALCEETSAAFETHLRLSQKLLEIKTSPNEHPTLHWNLHV